MSRQRSLSWDRAHYKQQQELPENFIRGDRYIPERSPNRMPSRFRTLEPNPIPSTPDMYIRNYGGGGLEDNRIVCVDENNNEDVLEESYPENFMQRPFDFEDLPGEFLDEFEAPSFQDLPANTSFDEVRCILATPPPAPQPATPTAAEKLESFRAEVAEVIEIDNLRKRMAAHIGTSAEDQPAQLVEIDDVRRRMAAVIGESKPEPPLCPYKIPPLPEDPHVIPPPPKDPKDVVAIIRRAQAIARLKAIEEAKAPKPPPKAVPKKGVRSVATISKKLPHKTPVSTLPKPTVKAVKPTKLPKIAALRKPGLVRKKEKEAPTIPQYPPDYVPDEWAAAILRTRKLAGLKTTNVKLLPKPKTPLPAPTTPVLTKSSLSPAAPKIPTLPTFANIMERVAAIRSKTDVAKAVLEDRKEKTLIPNPQDELDEFEALEQLYGATKSDQYTSMQESVNDLQNRIDALQQQLLQTPPPLQHNIGTTSAMSQEEDLDEFKTLEQLYGAGSYDQYPVTEAMEDDLKNRINTLQRKLFQSPVSADPGKRSPIYEIPSILRYQDLLRSREAMAAAAAQVSLMQKTQMDSLPEYEFEDDSSIPYEILKSPLITTPPQRTYSRPPSRPASPRATPKRSHSPAVITPKRSRSPEVTSQICPSSFDDAFLRNIEMPDFDIRDIPEFAFSAETLADAGFEIGDEISVGDISMPDFKDDISLDELGLEDVTSPDLCDLSISDVDLALEPDYPLEITTEEEEEELEADKIDHEQSPKSQGFLNSMVSAVVDRFRNIFSPSKLEEREKDEEDELNLDTSLPNMFETTPPPKLIMPPPKKPTPVKAVEKKPSTPIVIPPHPKDPKDYTAIVKRAQAIQKKKAQEAAMAPHPSPPTKDKKGKPEIKSSIPKRAPPPKKKVPVQKKKKEERPAKVYPPGEYSPSDARAVARARTLAGIKNRSALLNPERAARIAERKAAREAELAAIEALPTVERMRKKMEGMQKRLGSTLPRPSIEALGTLEAIRANLPIPKPTKPKWRPTGRLRADRRVKPSERVFRADFGRVLIPTKRTQKKKGWKDLDVMSPIVEETQFPGGDFLQFSPLKPHEGQKRLQYLKEQAAMRAAETIRAAEEAQAAISFHTPTRQRTSSPGHTLGTPQMSVDQFSPIQLLSPTSPRTEETKREKVITKIGPHGGAETIREEVTETSTVENGEIHTLTRQVTTKTDEYGNVTCHIQEGKGLSGEEEVYPEALADIEPPDFLDTSDIPPPRDPSIPSPAEIIERIRSQVQQKLNLALPDISQSPKPASPGPIDFPQDLTDEELFDIEIPEFERTPVRISPQVKAYTPIEKDQRMYAWGEIPASTPPPRMPTPPRVPTPKAATPKPIRPKTPEGVICVPPHPKDPKDYKAMVKRAQAIQRLKKQEEEILAKTAPPPPKTTGKKGRIPISRWVAPPPKDPKRPPRKRLVLKKRVPKISPKQKIVPLTEEEDDEIRECPSEPPPLPQEYRDAVARTRLMHGLTNRTAALNQKVAAKLAAKKAADEAAQAAYDALPEHEKIKRRMEKVRKIPAKKRRVEASADILGTIAAIRANMPPIEEVLRQPSPKRSPTAQDLHISIPTVSPRTPQTAYSPMSMPQAPMRIRPRTTTPSPQAPDESLDEFEFMEQFIGAQPVTSEVCVPVKEIVEDESFEIPDMSLLRPYVSPGQVLSPVQKRAVSPSDTLKSSPSIPAFESTDLSLDEFEKLEAELRPDMSLDEFEALEAEAQKLYNYETPKRGERHWGRQLAHQFTPSPRIKKPEHRTTSSKRPDMIDLLTPSPRYSPRSKDLSPVPFVQAPSMRMLGQVGFFQEQGLFDEESILGNESLKRPFVTPRADAKPGTIYYDEMQDFRVPEENIVLETSQLMTETPPKNLQERFQILKEAHEKRLTTPTYAQHLDYESVTPSVVYSPIRLMSPSGAQCLPPGQYEEESFHISSSPKNEWLLNIDETPEKRAAVVRQFRDLEDMPFDELEYELEPSLADVSYEKPISPPPRPSDIISRIRSQVQQQLKERADHGTHVAPEMLPMPEELPDEELFELSAPSFARTPPKTPPPKYRSPRVSLPMAWGEVRPVSPVTPPSPTTTPSRTPTPVKVTPPRTPVEKEKMRTPEGPIVVPPHPKDPKDYAAMVRRAQVIYKLKKQQEAEEAATAPPPPPVTAKKGRVPISRWIGPPPKKVTAKPRKKLVMRKRVPQTVPEKKKIEVQQIEEEEENECPAEPPPLAQEYRDAVARARLMHGLKNRTAALNPKVAAKIAAKKAAEEAAAAAFDALPEHEKIKVRMERLRKKPRRRRGVKPTMEQIAYLEALKQIGEYQYPPTPCRLFETPRAKTPTPQRLSITPRADIKCIPDIDSKELAEFEALEQYEAASVCPPISTHDKFALKERIADLEQQLLETEGFPQTEDVSLAEFEALEALEAPHDQGAAQSVAGLDMDQLISNLQQQLLATPPRIEPKERYRQLLAQRKTPPSCPAISPVKTPDIHYSPLTLPTSPSRDDAKKRAEKSTTQITRRGNNVIKEQVIETSEIVDGELQHFTTHVTTTTDPQDEFEIAEELGDIEEPSFLNTTPVTPMERPRPRDLIEKVRQRMKETYRPEVPTGHLVELRTPPRMLPLPEEVPDEELRDFSCPSFERTPTRTPTRSPARSPVRSPDVSIPKFFVATPPPPTPPLPPVSPLRHRIHSPEGPIVVPAHPKDPTDYKSMVRRARKIQQLIEQNEAEVRAEEEAKAAAVAVEAAKPKKKERVPISRWTGPPPKKPGKRKKLVMRKRVDTMTAKTPAKSEQIQPIEEEEIDYSQPPPLPENYAQEVAMARILAGLKNRTAALNPKVAAREAAKAEKIRKAQEAEAARLALLNVPPPSPIRNYATAIARMKTIKEKGVVPRGKPSIASVAYLDALKGAMENQQQPTTEPIKYESPKARYQRIMAERIKVPTTIEESPIRTPTREDIYYSPVRFVSPYLEEDKIEFPERLEAEEFDIAAFENLDELEELGEFEEPSFIDVSKYSLSEDQYVPLTPPPTPPPQPSAIISKLRKQYEQQQALICPSPLATPTALQFPEELPEEELFELSAPSFAKSPIKTETPIRSPNISIPYYFAETPPPKVVTPKSVSRRKSKSPTLVQEEEVGSPPLIGVCPGIKVKTPLGPVAIPPHPIDPTDVAAMIRRAQLIQKLRAKENAEQVAAAKAAKVRVPISRRIGPPPVPKKGKVMRRIVLKKKVPDSKAKPAKPSSPREYPTEPPELPAEYIAEVAKARRLAGLKNKTALLNPKVAARQLAQLAASKAATPLVSVQAKPTPPPPDYATIMERAAALRAAKAKMQKGPTARELTTRQHLINRQQRQERKRLLAQLERLRQEEGFNKSIDFEPIKTPPPARERFHAIKSRIKTETPTSSQYPYSPVKTPDAVDLPQYQPLVLPPTPPYQFLENVRIPDIADLSMQFEDFNDYELDAEDFAVAEDMEFQLAEEAAEKLALDENNNLTETETVQELQSMQKEFDIAERIEKLQQQLLESPIKTDMNALEKYNMAERVQQLQQQFLQTPIRQKLPQKEANQGYVCVDINQFDDETEENNHQDIYDEMMDDFEAMEREYC